MLDVGCWIKNTSNIQHPTSNIQHLTSNIQYPISNIKYQISKITKLNSQRIYELKIFPFLGQQVFRISDLGDPAFF